MQMILLVDVDSKRQSAYYPLNVSNAGLNANLVIAIANMVKQRISCQATQHLKYWRGEMVGRFE